MTNVLLTGLTIVSLPIVSMILRGIVDTLRGVEPSHLGGPRRLQHQLIPTQENRSDLTLNGLKEMASPKNRQLTILRRDPEDFDIWLRRQKDISKLEFCCSNCEDGYCDHCRREKYGGFDGVIVTDEFSTAYLFGVSRGLAQVVDDEDS